MSTARSNLLPAFAASGMVAAIDIETGIVYTDAADKSNHVFSAHPDTGFVFKGFQVPRWEELKRIALKLAPIFPGIPLIGWDMVLSQDRGWQLMESNGRSGLAGVQVAAKIGCRKQLEDAFEWDKHHVKLKQKT